jgi:ferritin-like metal-binding protein YciE
MESWLVDISGVAPTRCLPMQLGLTDLYTGELQDLWSANDQMARNLKKITRKVSDAALKTMLAGSQAGIAKHTAILRTCSTPMTRRSDRAI